MSQSKSTSLKNETVVVIHGLGSSRVFMLPLWMQIRRSGFAARNFGYASYFKDIETHANAFFEYLTRLHDDPEIEKLHLVAHSMGSIVIRQMLQQQRLEKLQRIVMLGPPNAGSPAARMLSYLLPLSKTVKQISDRPGSFVQQLSPISDVELGIVAGSYDFVIPKTASHLTTQQDHITLFSGHNGLLFRPKAAKQTIAFLKRGRFEHP